MSDGFSPPFYVEFKENPGFLGREADLEAVHHALHAQPTDGVREAVGIVPAGVTGMGGIGKTQLAVKYVYAYREHYPDGIYWLNGANSLYQEFADLGRQLQGMEADYATQKRLFDWLNEYFDEGELRTLCFAVHVKFDDLLSGGLQDKARELVTHVARRGQLALLEGAVLAARPHLQADKTGEKRDSALDELVGYAFSWLQARPQALLVLDNLEEPKRLHEPVSRNWIVTRLACSVLFTTRRHELPGCRPVALTVLPEDVALKLLLRHRPEVAQPDHLEHETARSICHSLGYLPLALEVASAHLKLFPNAPLQKYQAEMYQRGMLIVLGDKRAPVKTRHETGLQAALSGQWQQLPSEEARHLLLVAGQLPEAAQIPAARLGLLAGVPEEGPSFFDMTLGTALAQLVDASLLEKLAEDLVRLHPLVRDFAHQQIPAEARDSYLIAFSGNLASAFEDVAELEKQCRKRGADALQEDLLTTIELIEPLWQSSRERINIPPWYKTDEKRQRILRGNQETNVPERLKMLLRLVQREIHTLRYWQPEQQPVFFTQQIAYRVLELDIKTMKANVTANLRQKLLPYLQVIWANKQESSALERTLTGHWEWVRGVAVSPDGWQAISVSNDRTLRIWNLETGVEKQALTGHWDWINAVAITPDGHRAISASNDHTLIVWNLKTGSKEQTLIGHSKEVRAVAVSPDGRQVVSASNDRTIKMWNIKTGVEEKTFTGHSDGVSAVIFSPDHQRIISAADDQTLRVWNIETGGEEQRLLGHSDKVNAVAITPDGQRIISASNDRTLKIWDFITGMEVHALTNHTAEVNAVAISPDGQSVISASSDRTLKVWNLETGVEEQTLTGHSILVSAVTIHPDGRQIISASYDRTLKVWNLESINTQQTLNSHWDWVSSVAIIDDSQWHNKRRVISASNDRTLKVWNLETSVEDKTLKGHSKGVRAIALTSDGQRVISASYDSALKVWNLETGVEERTFSGHSGWVMAVDVTLDGQRMVSASSDHTLKVWNLKTGRTEKTLKGHTQGVNAVAIFPNGRQVISASDDYTLKVWNIETGIEERTLIGHTNAVVAVTVTLDGRQAISAGLDRTVKVWNLEDGTEERSLKGHSNVVRAITIVKDPLTFLGQRVITTSDDRTLRVWEFDTGELLASIGLDGALYCIAAIANGMTTIVTGDGAGSIYCLRYIEPGSGSQLKNR